MLTRETPRKALQGYARALLRATGLGEEDLGRPRDQDPLAQRARHLVPLDRDPVVVINPAQVRQPQVSGNRRCLAADSFHKVAVGNYSVSAMVHRVPIVSGESFR